MSGKERIGAQRHIDKKYVGKKKVCGEEKELKIFRGLCDFWRKV